MSILSKSNSSLLLRVDGADHFSPSLAGFKSKGRKLTLPEAVDALASIDPNLPRGEWVRLAASLYSEFGDDAMEAYDAWSEQGSSYSVRDFRSMWTSLAKLDQISIGTLIFHAKAAGWVRNRRDNGVPKPTAFARRGASRQAIRKGIASEKVQARFESYSPAQQEHPYLLQKRIRPYRLKEDQDGSLVVPLTNGNLMTGVQLIRPWGSKQYLRGTSKAGSFYPVEFSAKTPRDAPLVGICEGVATGHSLFEHTLIPIYCAMDAGNLVPVAQALRRWYRVATLIFYADNDIRGSGQRKAMEASFKVCGKTKIHMPPDPGSDWNDFVNSRRDASEAEDV